MRYISLFSGIEAASVAWKDLEGWEPVAFSEIDKFPSAVLAYRFPNVPNLGDITKIDWSEVIAKHGAVDLIVGGSPCQSFSIAGRRESLDGESRLMFEYIRAVQDVRPKWFLWENVPGVLSTRDNAFEQLLTEMEKLGYGMAWGTLDAQFFGVAQRRRRVFLVGCLGNGGAAAAVLFEHNSVSGNTQPSSKKREELTRAIIERTSNSGSELDALCLQTDHMTQEGKVICQKLTS
jgi:DNA (cytosine-5)-methyltransferase 1